MEDGEIMFEEVEVDADEPLLRELAAWCERHTNVSAKPPVKAGRAEEREPRKRVGNP